jgi:O-antigen/teichoic acid export membrane protein
MSRFAGALATNTDMLVAAVFLGPVQAVAANMTQKGPGILRMFIDRVSHSAMPSLSAIHAGNNQERCSRSAVALLRTVVWMVIPAAVGVVLLNRTFVALWVGKQHYAGDVATGIIATTMVAIGLEVTLSNVAWSFGLFQASGRILLIRSGITSLLAVLLAWWIGVPGLLAAPLVAGACTTWWLLPRLINQACGWRWRNWLPLAQESARVLAAAGLAAGAAAAFLREDVTSFLLAGIAYVVGFLTMMAAGVPMFRDAMSQVWSAVARRLYPAAVRNRTP